MPIVMRHIVVDRTNEVRHAAKGAAANPLAGDLGEPALDQIEPRRARRDEMAVVRAVSTPLRQPDSAFTVAPQAGDERGRAIVTDGL